MNVESIIFSGEATVIGHSGPCCAILEFKYGHGDLGSLSVFWNLENGSSSLAMEDLAFGYFLLIFFTVQVLHKYFTRF